MTSEHPRSRVSSSDCSFLEASRIRLGIFVCLFFLTLTSSARADWLIVPFFGGTFASQTTLPDPERSAGKTKKVIIGASGALLTDGLIGFEGDFSYVPGFFHREDVPPILVGSSVSTLSGSVMVAAPLSVTRESLRPYLAGGLGLLHAGIEDQQNVQTQSTNLLAMNVGGGAIGLVTTRTGVRFDLRNIRSVRGNTASLTGMGRARLSFWRATVGVILRY